MSFLVKWLDNNSREIWYITHSCTPQNVLVAKLLKVDPLTFNLAPSSGQHFNLFSTSVHDQKPSN